MKQWEYRTFSFKLQMDEDEYLNEAGHDCWELVAVAVFNGEKHFYCKRPLPLDLDLELDSDLVAELVH